MREQRWYVAPLPRFGVRFGWLLSAIGLLVGSGAAPAWAQDAVVQGTVNYEKVPATQQGLRFNAVQTRPAAGVNVWIVKSTPAGTPFTQLAGGVTDENGFYRITVPLTEPTTVYVHVRAEAENARVANPNGEAIYAYRYADFVLAPGQTVARVSSLIDNGRSAGPFNILANIRAANRAVRAVAPGINLPAITIKWATNYRDGTGFAPPGAIYLNGDRDVDSDEYDDGVVLHEYGHFLAYHFSRDEFPGFGIHRLGTGEQLDPRLAYSEGWANFFAQAVLNDPNWVRTFGPNGSQSSSYNLEPNVQSWDQPSYASEWTVATVLWDLFDNVADPGDPLALGLGPIWQAFAGGLRGERDVYLIDLIDVLARDNASRTDVIAGIASILGAHQITYTPGAVPSVADPFPLPLPAGATVTGTLDSTVPVDRPDRWNLRSAKAWYSFSLAAPAGVDLLLMITDSTKPATADLDLYLFNEQNEVIAASTAANGIGGTERIQGNLPAGNYRLEVWSARRDSGWRYNTAAFQLKAAF